MPLPTDDAPPARPVQIARWSELEDREPAYALVGEVDLVVERGRLNRCRAVALLRKLNHGDQLRMVV